MKKRWLQLVRRQTCLILKIRANGKKEDNESFNILNSYYYTWILHVELYLSYILLVGIHQSLQRH